MWKPALIANPAFYKDETPLANIGKIDAVAIEIWTMDSGFFFDDIVVANDPSLAAEFREKTYGPKKVAEVCSCGPACAHHTGWLSQRTHSSPCVLQLVALAAPLPSHVSSSKVHLASWLCAKVSPTSSHRCNCGI